METKNKLRIFTFNKDNKSTFKKELDLPLYLADINSFSIYLHKNCGCHLFHIEFETGYKKWLTLCDINIKKNKKTGITYKFQNEDYRNRLMLFLNNNKKSRSTLKLAEQTSNTKKRIKIEYKADYYG
ncbi:MAG: hypothetical protein K0B07_03675 [DPANN group archaeon]|nr:hypothetical protein [DPANN group archaeon]